MVGQALIPRLKASGYRVQTLTRNREESGNDAIFWDPSMNEIEAEKLEGVHAAIHLAGENIASGRWTKAKKKRILESRTKGTALLAQALAGLSNPPELLLSASGINYYGNRGEDLLTEDDPPGKGFLADVCRQWEAAAEPAENAGIRVVRLRIGPVLSPAGGMLKKILPPFRAGAGGRVGSGTQYLSWIALPDLIEVMEFILENPKARGAYNAVAPNPVTNAEFTRALAKIISRPALVPIPAMVLRITLGEMADEMLLASTRGRPQRLEAAGFQFQYPELEPALRKVLESPSKPKNR